MGLWPFGRDPADIELASRVVTAATQSGHRVRGKLTIHFLDPQRKEEAELAADRCAAVAVALLREAPDHGRVIGAEAQLSADLTARYPSGVARARAVELAALHVVGDPALSDELRRASGSFAATQLPGAPPPGSVRPAPSSVRPPPSSGNPPPASAPASVRPPSSRPPSSRPPTSRPPIAGPAERAAPPPSASWGGVTPTSFALPGGPAYRPTPSGGVPSGYRPTPSGGIPSPAGPPMRRRGSSQIRSIQSLLMPPGTSPTAMGQFVAPLARDSAARLLVGFLRGHDLIAVRGVMVDETSVDMLATLVPTSDAPPGGYEASRAGEIARWQAALGQDVMRALQRQVRVTSAYLAKEALARVEVMPALADAVLDALCLAAFPDEAGVLGELSGFPSPMPADFAATLARSLVMHASTGDDPAAMTSALTPLVAAVKDDFLVSAMIIKASSGG